MLPFPSAACLLEERARSAQPFGTAEVPVFRERGADHTWIGVVTLDPLRSVG